MIPSTPCNLNHGALKNQNYLPEEVNCRLVFKNNDKLTKKK